MWPHMHIMYVHVDGAQIHLLTLLVHDMVCTYTIQFFRYALNKKVVHIHTCTHLNVKCLKHVLYSVL